MKTRRFLNSVLDTHLTFGLPQSVFSLSKEGRIYPFSHVEKTFYSFWEKSSITEILWALHVDEC
jgi:hypothetical protein